MNSSFSWTVGHGGQRITHKTGEILCCCILLVIMAFPANAAPDDTPPGPEKRSGMVHKGVNTSGFEDSSSCSLCHQNIYKQFRESMHARSFSNPLFLKTFFDVVLKGHADDKSLAEEAEGCIACHSPFTSLRSRGNTPGQKPGNPDNSGVECDLCHRITGYRGDLPQNGNYLATPGTKKFGPFQHQSDWHHAYSELQTRSEVCAVCHNRVNRFGLEIISTYSEWKSSRYAQEGVQCQDCHMNANGFLSAGKAVYESGMASQNLSAKSPERSRLYTHRFPGAHSESQVKGAIKLYMQIEDAALAPGKEATINVIVDNSKSGHRLPTGTAELRLIYLDLSARTGGRTIPIPALPVNEEMFDVSGMGRFDAEFLGEGFPRGRRLYRAICVDSSEKQTFYGHVSEKIIFDNRLAADEVRKETFTFSIPEDAGQELSFTAKLYYLRYPDPFAAILRLEKAESVELAAVSREVDLGGQSE